MSVPRRILLQIQEDAFARASAAEYLQDIAVILERRAFTEQEAKKLLGTSTARNGKVGACVLVQRPIATPDPDNAAGRAQVVLAFSVLEHPTINAGTLGTGKSAEEIAIELFDLFQFAAVSAPDQVFSAFPGGAIVPDDSFDGLNAWEVRFRTFVSIRRTNRTPCPIITPEEGTAPQVVTIEAAAGADTYITTDNSFPWSGNPAAVLYSAPLNLSAAARVRAVSYLSGYQPSATAEAVFS